MNDAASEVLQAARDRGARRAEVYWKVGRSRSFLLEEGRESSISAREAGWALRAGSDRGSVFVASSGSPDAAATGAKGTPLPEAGSPLRLPEPRRAPLWRRPEDLEAPLLSELEGLRLVRSVAERLEAELPGARLDRAVLVDGSNEARLQSSLGVDTVECQRLGYLRVTAHFPGVNTPPPDVEVTVRCGRDLRPGAVARRLVDRLLIQRDGASLQSASTDVLVAPELAAALLDAWVPAFVGPRVPALLEETLSGSSVVTLVDDGRFGRGPLPASTDGEGVPTGRVAVVEEGTPAGRLVPWWDGGTGCRLRPSWREPPETGATQFYLEPDASIAPAHLLSELTQGYYLLETTAPGSFELSSGRFSFPCCGFEVEKGRPRAPVRDVRLEGRMHDFLGGVRAVARDLTFVSRASRVGSPSVLVSGLELRGG